MEAGSKYLAAKLVFLRRCYGISARKVAELLEIAPQTYSGYETGRHTPSLEKLIQIADLYGITLDKLVGRFGYENGQ